MLGKGQRRMSAEAISGGSEHGQSRVEARSVVERGERILFHLT